MRQWWCWVVFRTIFRSFSVDYMAERCLYSWSCHFASHQRATAHWRLFLPRVSLHDQTRFLFFTRSRFPFAPSSSYYRIIGCSLILTSEPSSTTVSTLTRILPGVQPIVPVSISYFSVTFGAIGCKLTVFLFYRPSRYISWQYLVQVTWVTHRWPLIAASFDRYALSSSSSRLRSTASALIARWIASVIILMWLMLSIYSLVLYNIRAGACGVFDDYAGSLSVTFFTLVNTSGVPPPLMIIFAPLIQNNMAHRRLQRHILINPHRNRTTPVDQLQRK